ncbi:MAG: hypothetical protein R6U52_06130 [Kosmotogaceae bacterium]
MKKITVILVLAAVALFLISCNLVRIPLEGLTFEFEFEAENPSVQFVPTSNGEMREYKVEPPQTIPNPLVEEEIPLGMKIKKIELTIIATVTQPDDFQEFDYEGYLNLTEYSTDTTDLFVTGSIKPGTNKEEVSSEDYSGVENLIDFLESDNEEADVYVTILHNYGKDATETAYGKLRIEGIAYIGY